MANQTTPQSGPGRRVRLLKVGLLAAASCLLLLHFVHPGADLPNGSPWRVDQAKFTDEGWYGDEAIRECLTGRWYLPGDFNPAATLPVWPLLETLSFRLSGVSIEVARGTSVLLLVAVCGLAWALLHRWRRDEKDPSAEFAVLLLASSPFLFAFSRLAVLELPVVFWTLLALLGAESTRPRRRWPPFASGACAAAMVLTKTTAVAMWPAIAVLLWARCRSAPANERSSRDVLPLALAVLSAAVLLGSWWAWVRHAGLQADVHVFFGMNADRVNRHNLLRMGWQTLLDLRWLGTLPVALCLVAVVQALRRWRNDPPGLVLLLWVGGYLSFILYHTNLQPRYYVPVAVPLLLLLAREAGPLLMMRGKVRWIAAAAVALMVCTDSARMVDYALHPEWTLYTAAREVGQIVNRDPDRSRLVLGSSAAELALVNRLPHINGLFATVSPEALVDRYRPGWVLLWKAVDGSDAEPRLAIPLRTRYSLVEVRRWQVMDLPQRQILVLYRLEP